MIALIKGKWAIFSIREKWLIGIMLTLLVMIILWLGVLRPIESGLASAKARHAAAIDRSAAIRARVAAIKTLSGQGSPVRRGPLDVLIGQSAAETGFTLNHNERQGEDRVAFMTASVRPTAFFGWLASLEAQGIQVESLSVEPTDNVVLTANGVLRASGR
ncbi:type II secretion system protein GspM [Rhizorhapis suberifaciens]|uniref:General secretion pathway protein M n=1 Tax=Rhizorhapis suberifaciens TaxID=13656 RepID=A0A840HTV5_9SPHN|nr:type II secretion system protein GspM [Rhizorhapis suberifaciens]MBB4641037.1 general secretion pathway protein M [Rhizorhapis suberifaciens]